MGPVQISIIVVSYNVQALLQQCLASLPDSCDIIVVDNASVDGSAEMVRTHFAHVTLVELPTNMGFSAAINAGAQRARGDALLLLNPDTELAPGSLPRMAKALGASADTAAVGFRQVDADGRFQLAVGPEPNFVGELCRRFVQRRLDRGHQSMARLVDRVLSGRRRVAWVAGSSLLVWTVAFRRIGGFDARYFLFFEDIDFCLRLRSPTQQVYYDSSVTVLHHRGASAKTSHGRAEAAYRQSQVLFWRTHRSRMSAALMAGYVALRARR